jgi:DnaJ-class molecular chaperone
MVDIKRTCPKCFGTGVHHKNTPDGIVDTDPCPKCDGSGKIVLLTVDLSDIEGKLDDIMDRCNDIFEGMPGRR